MRDQLRGDGGFDALEFVVQRGQRDGDPERLVQVGGPNRTVSGSDDLSHQIDHRGKGQLARVLAVRLFLEQRIQRLWSQRPFQQTSRHHCEWRFFHESLECLPQQHTFPLFLLVVSPCRLYHYSESRSPWKGWSKPAPPRGGILVL